MERNEIYEKDDGWYYRTDDNVEWGPFESFQEAEDMALTPETNYVENHPETEAFFNGELEGED